PPGPAAGLRSSLARGGSPRNRAIRRSGSCCPFASLSVPSSPDDSAAGTFSGSGCITSQREFSAAGQGAMNDDLDAIGRVLAADVESFRRLVERYQRPLLTLIRNLTPPDTDHEGVAQEVFLAAFRSLASFDPKRSAFSTWLFNNGSLIERSIVVEATAIDFR